MYITEITPTEFVTRRNEGEVFTLLDVREAWELEVARIDGALHIPMGEVPGRLGDIDRGHDVVVLCRSGRRSYDVAVYLKQNGFRAVNLAGGILAWAREIDPDLTTY